jgi:hypothetical protein
MPAEMACAGKPENIQINHVVITVGDMSTHGHGMSPASSPRLFDLLVI